MIRPELIEWTRRNAEALGMVALILGGLWVATRGGPALAIVGGAIVLLGVVLLRSALLRLRFSRRKGDPGMVMVDELRVGYFGPDNGGFFEMGQVKSIDLMTYSHRRALDPAWRGGTVDDSHRSQGRRGIVRCVRRTVRFPYEASAGSGGRRWRVQNAPPVDEKANRQSQAAPDFVINRAVLTAAI